MIILEDSEKFAIMNNWVGLIIR